MKHIGDLYAWYLYRLLRWWDRHAGHVAAALVLTVLALLCVIAELVRYIAVSG